MKKRTAGFVYLTLSIIIMSCAFEIPQMLTITGDPKVYIPLSNPFNSLDPEERLEYLVSLEGIRAMMNKADVGDTGTQLADKSHVKIYSYEVPDEYDGYQTYAVHYPLVELQHDLTDYIDGKLAQALNMDGEKIHIDVPFTPPSFPLPPGVDIYPYYLTPAGPAKTPTPMPLYNLELSDMYKIILKVEGEDAGKSFGIEVPFDDAFPWETYGPDFKEYLWVYIPAFGFDDYIQGEKAERDGITYLQFMSEKDEFLPGDLEDGILKAYFMVKGPCSGLRMPQIVFNWTRALIDTTSSDHGIDRFKGDFKIENALGKFLGAGVKFKEIQGYMFITGIDGDPRLSLTCQHDGGAIVDLYTENGGKLEEQTRPNFTDIITEKFQPINKVDFVKLTEMLNTPQAASLSYEVTINEMWIDNDETITTKKITADLVLLLPLIFKADEESGYEDEDGSKNYVKISLNDLLPKLAEGEEKTDILMRDKDGDGVLSKISYIRIVLRNYINDVLAVERDGRLDVLLTAERPDGEAPYQQLFNIMIGRGEPFLLINDPDELPNPFNPGFDVLVKKEKKADGTNENYAILGIQRQKPNSAFTFTIMVEAKTAINETITF
jgi:hypothetical protein